MGSIQFPLQNAAGSGRPAARFLDRRRGPEQVFPADPRASDPPAGCCVRCRRVLRLVSPGAAPRVMAGPGPIGVRIRRAAETPFLLCHGRRRPVARPDGSRQAEASEGKAHVPCHGRRGPGYDMGGSEFIQSEPAASRTLMRKQEKFYANSRRCTPSTQMAENASQAVHNALDLKARIAGVYCELCCSGSQCNSKEWKSTHLACELRCRSI